MDCQNCTYANLDSSDPEVYKKSDDDLKILIESEEPLLEKPKQVSGVKTVKRVKKKRRVLSTLDIFISIFIVTPCVVGCWRGIWQLMDIYSVYFPVWESFFLGMATHIVLALGQDVFHHVVVQKERKSWYLKIFAMFLMKFYITTFNVITNMVWRAGWLIFDQYCQLKTTPTGIVMWEESANMIWFTIVCTMILFCLKGLKNTLSPPFSIALDSKDEVFLFSTRYIYKVAYIITIFVIKKNATDLENKLGTAEKLTVSQPMAVKNVQNQSPRPFGIKILGPPPQEFTPTPTSTETTTPPNYPQLTQYRYDNYYPKNIQDIISYVTNNKDTRKNMYGDSEKQQATNQEGSQRNYNSTGFTNSDPFYPYKPSDPSEINLMATASFRFAPPAWKNFQKLYQASQQRGQAQQYATPQQVETSNVQETVKNFAKPFVVTLNIYPMGNDYPSGYSRYGPKVLSQRIQSDYSRRSQIDPRVSKAHKMTIQLNVFPESFLAQPTQDRERYSESAVNKIKFV